MIDHVDSRILIRDKFLKKTRNITIDRPNDSVRFLGVPEQTPDIIPRYSKAMDETKYTYLPDDPLSRETAYSLDNHPPIFVCVYTQQDELLLPYISYYLVKGSNSLMFPDANTTELTSGQSSQIESDSLSEGTADENDSLSEGTADENDSLSEEENLQDYIQPFEDKGEEDADAEPIVGEQITRVPDEVALSEPLIDIHTQHENDDLFFVKGSRYINNYLDNENQIKLECYKGYIESDGNIYIFFDITNLDFIEDFYNKHVSCIIDEIVNKKQVNDMLIDTIVSNLFITNAILRYFYEEKTFTPIHYPIRVYLCEDDDNEYTNATYDDAADHSTVSMISNPVYHPVVGKTYLFTNDLLDASDLPNIKRFALFHSDSVYVLHEPFITSEYDLIDEADCICFLSEGIEYWSVKNRELFSEI